MSEETNATYMPIEEALAGAYIKIGPDGYSLVLPAVDATFREYINLTAPRMVNTGKRDEDRNDIYKECDDDPDYVKWSRDHIMRRKECPCKGSEMAIAWKQVKCGRLFCVWLEYGGNKVPIKVMVQNPLNPFKSDDLVEQEEFVDPRMR